ncbi:hypothetical protein KJ784_00525 [Patescibacteria group bacterium]|nr:hypothetical protein [Patescibacteria group bacterium]
MIISLCQKNLYLSRVFILAKLSFGFNTLYFFSPSCLAEAFGEAQVEGEGGSEVIAQNPQPPQRLNGSTR